MAGLEYVAGSTRITGKDFCDAPISPSLLTVAIWAVLFAGAYFLRRR